MDVEKRGTATELLQVTQSHKMPLCCILIEAHLFPPPPPASVFAEVCSVVQFNATHSGCQGDGRKALNSDGRPGMVGPHMALYFRQLYIGNPLKLFSQNLPPSVSGVCMCHALYLSAKKGNLEKKDKIAKFLRTVPVFMCVSGFMFLCRASCCY